MPDEKPVPGSVAAQKAGCKCPVIDNHYGRGYAEDGEGKPVYVMNEDCPIHGGECPKLKEVQENQAEPIREDEDCCEVWPIIAKRFDWMRYTDQPNMCSLPHIDTIYQGKFFINFCPSCGKPARDRNMLRSRLED